MPAEERIGVESYFGLKDFLRNTATYDKILGGLEKRTAGYGRSVSKSTAGASKSWNAYGQSTDAVVGELRRDLISAEKNVQRFGNENRQVTQQAAGDWQRFSGSVIGQVMKFKATLEAGRYMFQAFLKPFRQFIAIGTEGAGMARMQRGLMRMVGTQEAYNDALIEMRAATMGTIKDTDLIGQAFKIMNLGLADTAEMAAKVTRNVTLLARAAGQVPSPESAMQVFALMMSNQSRQRLDAFGLSIGETDARIKMLKETMGVSQAEAFRIAIFELMDERVESMGLSIEDAATKTQRMTAQFGNVTDTMKSMVLPEFEDFVAILSKLATAVVDNSKNVELWYRTFVGALRGLAYWWGDVAGAAVMFFKLVTDGFSGNIAGAIAAQDALQNYLKRIGTGASYFLSLEHEVSKMYDNMGISAEEMAQRQIDALTGAADQALAAYTDMRTEWDEKLATAQEAAEKRLANITIREVERAIDAVIAAQRRREDAARELSKRLAQIEMQYATAVAAAQNTYIMTIQNARDQLNKRLLAIEEAYQKAKRRIQDQYEMAEWEAIAARDATALLKARRTRDKALADAGENYDDQKGKAHEQHQEQEKAAKQALANQEIAARESYRKQMADLEANLKEKAEAQRRADEHAAEDAERARARERGKIKTAQGSAITDLYLHYNAELSMATTHHANMLAALDDYMNQYRMRQGMPWMPSAPAPPTMGFAQGGAFIARSPMNITVGEGGRPEMVIVQPLGESSDGTVNHVVSGQVEAQVQATIQQSIAGFEGRIHAAMMQALNDVFR